MLRIRLAEPFTNKQFLKLGSRASVDKALSRLVSEGVIQRIIRGVLMRPKANRFVGLVAPECTRSCGSDGQESRQNHPGFKVQRQSIVFKLSTRVPVLSVFFTSGSSREFKIGNLTVHASGMTVAGSFYWMARDLEWQSLLCGIWGKTMRITVWSEPFVSA